MYQTPTTVAILILSIALVLFSCSIYVLMHAIYIPYERRTDRLWKIGWVEPESDDPEKEDVPKEDCAVIDLRSRLKT
jgi:hypothetical protein